MPFLGILAGIQEEMGFFTPIEKIIPYLPERGRCEVLDDLGHFVHIERPDLISEMVLDFVGAPQ